ncbi:MAG: hypothetical protein K8J09_01275, partial [Planctomycetes bacterium]|nr:hypothetical protein [Planctomycetota bacterium]
VSVETKLHVHFLRDELEEKAASRLYEALSPHGVRLSIGREIPSKPGDIDVLIAGRPSEEDVRACGDSLRAIKVGCRAGMGPCQGRICGSSLQALATGRFDVVPDLPVAQVPAKPVRSATIVDAPEPPATA